MKKRAFPKKRDTFQAADSDFLGMYSRKIIKSNVFQSQETLFEGRSSPMSLLPGPQATNSGSHKWQIVNSCLTSGRVTFWSVQVLQPHDLRRMEANKMGQKGSRQQRAVLGPMRIRAARSKIILFLFKNNSFGATGENDAG